MEALQLQREIGTNINRPLVARIRAAMLKKGLNPKTLAERANVGRSFVYDIMNGKSGNPTSAKLTAIADQLGVSVQYLLSGVYSSESTDSRNDIAEIATLAVVASGHGNSVVTPPGSKCYFFQHSWVRDKLGINPQNLKAIKISGDSMAPTFNNGDIVLVNTSQQSPNPPGLFILFDGLGLHPKRLEQINKETIRVMSDNAQYLAYEMAAADINIIGQIVWLGREL